MTRAKAPKMSDKLINRMLLFSGVAILIACSPNIDIANSTESQNEKHDARSLTLTDPIRRWDNAIPLGKGLTGGLLWGEGNELRPSLDRGDLWDERGDADAYSAKRTFATLLDSYKARDRATWEKYFDATYYESKWTEIPGGRLVMLICMLN